MILKSVQILSYKSVADSGLFEIDPKVTCLVGKNESGKTAVLEALYRLNPLPGHIQDFKPLRDYPRRTLKAVPEEKINQTVPISVTFEVQDDDLEEISEEYGETILTAGPLGAKKNYKNVASWGPWPYHEDAHVKQLVADAGVDASLATGAKTVDELIAKLKTITDPPEAVKTFITNLEAEKPYGPIWKALQERIPKFLYFDEYSVMPGRVSITKLQTTPEANLSPSERTALSLLRLAGVDAAEFTDANYEARKASLEAAANLLTDEVFEFWSQNKDLSIELDVDFKSPGSELGQPPFLDIRIKNSKHRVTLNFGERSKGFIWFFSFLAFFSEFRNSDDPLVLLLDEPGMGLHAAAQKDLLRFIEERLAQTRQVIYTTHSPFMIDPQKLERARTVEDIDGTKVSADVFRTSKDTRFPLQAALGYDLAQTLFVGPNNLVVEGPADYVYFQVIGSYLASKERTRLDLRWTVVPVGGIDKVPTFIALLGTQLNVAVVLEVAAGGSQKISSLVEKHVIEENKLIPLTDITGTPEADIEDLFEPDFYLDILRKSGVASIKESELKSRGRIIKRIEAVLGRRFDHYEPARYFLEHQVELLPKLSPETLDRFEKLFDRANSLLSSASGEKHRLPDSAIVGR